MNGPDEIRQARLGLRAIDARLDNDRAPSSGGGGDIVGSIVSLPASPAVGKSFQVRILRVTGPDGPPGTAASFATPTYPIIAAVCLGPNLPAASDKVLVSATPDGRWVFAR